MPPANNSSNEVNQYELSSRLLSLMENTSYTLTQINGQRIFRKAPHAWSGPEPLRNCEVFIGRIPHDCFEDTLVPIFQQAGELFEFRLMINFSGWNRGYAFAMYTTESEAKNAIRIFNNYMIRPCWQLGVCPSINNCRLFISRIPHTTPSAEIVRLLYALTDEVQEVRIRRSITSCAAIVEYKSHRGAAMARKALVAVAAAAWGCGARPAVDWSLPQSRQLLRQYREVGHWTAEHGVELVRVSEDGGGCLPPVAAAAPTYTLEPWSQARRLRMIQEAQRNAAATTEWSNRIPDSGESLASSMASLNLGMGLGLGAAERSVWAPPAEQPMQTMQAVQPAQSMQPTPTSPQQLYPNQGSAVPEFNPWTTPHPLYQLFTPKKHE
ncbi:probable RNA-binding protein 46 [Achroia grisella]|uniref:probable RNA-binding protein 46 n=1 Tax=Achroia grisella TaxID=688607 RepID=UPI0027D3155B|nr:probable RNA-binding protein 46 [Achroia grisella]